MSLRFLIKGQMKNAHKNGFAVKMASADGEHLPEAKKYENVEHVIIPFERDISIFRDLKALLKTIYLFRKTKPQIVHTHTPKAGLLGMLAAKICRVPIRIHTVAGMPLEGLGGLKKKIVFITEKLTYSSANYIWPNSKSMVSFVNEHNLCNPSKINLIGQGSSNGIDLTQFNSNALESQILQEIKKSINYDDKLFYFSFVGRIVSQKGVNELVLAFLCVLKKYPHARLILVGPYENSRDPISPETKVSIDKNPEIISTGFSNKVKYFLHISDCLVFPSHREGFPNVPMQAGAMNCPVICSNITGNLNLIENNSTGLVHNLKDSNDIEEKMNYSINHPEKMQKLANNFLEYIRTNFQTNIVQKEIIDTYKNLLKIHFPSEQYFK
jgi:glycosyltransferase involved in cell wall biosynthesis